MDFQAQALLLAVVAALLLSCRNFFIKATDNRLILYGASNAICLVLFTAFMPFIAIPNFASLICIGISSLSYTFLVVFQLSAFQTMNLSVLEPLQKSIKIIVMLAFSTIFLGEHINSVQWIAIVFTIFGLYMIVDWPLLIKKGHLKNYLACVFAAILAAITSLTDIVGIRLSGDPLSYIIWNLLMGVPIVILALSRHASSVMQFLKIHWKNTCVMCFCDIIQYGLLLYILYSLNYAQAMPLLNLTIIFSALLGMFVLKEIIPRKNWTAIICLTLSVSLVQLT